MDIKQRVGIRIKTLREQRGIKQKQLSQAIKRTPEAVYQLEHGVSLPNFETLLRLRTALGITLSELMEGIDGEDITPERAMLMEKWRDLGSQLNDDDLTLAINQIQAMIQTRKG